VSARPFSLALALLLAACERVSQPPPPSAQASAPPFRAVATNRQLMEDVVEPAANVYWDAVGTVTDRNGTVERAPKTDAEWSAVRNAALVVTESGNLLMIEPRVRDRDEWLTLARALVDAGDVARKAAEAKDRKAVFDAGADLYDACVNCHKIYLVGEKAPQK